MRQTQKQNNKNKKMLDPQDSDNFLFHPLPFFRTLRRVFSFSVLSTFIATILTDQVKWTSHIIPEQAHGAVLENGIIFNHVTKILLAVLFKR